MPGPQHEPPSDLVCSARACGGRAVHALRWNNPRLHTPDRRKTWLACEEHLESLSQHLDVRGFLREVVPAEHLGDGARVRSAS
jgi:hypothetical protein